jgi:hypothetical protein
MPGKAQQYQLHPRALIKGMDGWTTYQTAGLINGFSA